MALIQWSSELSVQIKTIDKQHQHLIGMINELNDAMLHGKGKEIVGRIINGLVRYSKTHFSTEENYFSQFGYSHASEHVGEHEKFVKKATAFKNDFAHERVTLSIQVIDFLSDWLRNHILVTDKKYVAFFQRRGIR